MSPLPQKFLIALFLGIFSILLSPASAFAAQICDSVGQAVSGEWEVGDARSIRFQSGQSKVWIDGMEMPMQNCLVSRAGVLFFAENKMVNIRFDRYGRPASIFIDNKFLPIKQASAAGPINSDVPANLNVHDHYVAHQSTRFQEWYELMSDERIAQGFGTAAYQLSPQLKIEARECGVSNAFYTPTTTTITICYEYLADGAKVIDQTYSSAPVSVRSNMKSGIMAGVLLHEIGHAIIHLKEIPLLGGEEDAADRFAYVMMHRMAAADPVRLRDMVYGNLAYSWAQRPDVLTKILSGPTRYMDEHPITEQRYYNLVCLAYGSDSKLFDDLRQGARLNDRRAMRCSHEFNQAQSAVRKLAN